MNTHVTKSLSMLAIVFVMLIASCSKSDQAASPEQSNTAARGPYWDVVSTTYSQSLSRPVATITFGTTWSGTGGTGTIWMAPTNGSGVITGAWFNPVVCSGYSGSFNPGLMYLPGTQFAMTFEPGVTVPTTAPPSQVGYTVNSVAWDHIELATVVNVP